MYDGEKDELRAATRPNPQKGRSGSQLLLNEKEEFIREWLRREKELKLGPAPQLSDTAPSELKDLEGESALKALGL